MSKELPFGRDVLVKFNSDGPEVGILLLTSSTILILLARTPYRFRNTFGLLFDNRDGLVKNSFGHPSHIAILSTNFEEAEDFDIFRFVHVTDL